jgi:hypothetical protein
MGARGFYLHRMTGDTFCSPVSLNLKRLTRLLFVWCVIIEQSVKIPQVGEAVGKNEGTAMLLTSASRNAGLQVCATTPS